MVNAGKTKASSLMSRGLPEDKNLLRPSCLFSLHTCRWLLGHASVTWPSSGLGLAHVNRLNMLKAGLTGNGETVLLDVR